MWIFSKYTENYENCKNMQFPLLRKMIILRKIKRLKFYHFSFIFKILNNVILKFKKMFKIKIVFDKNVILD